MAAERSSAGIAARVVVLGGIVLAVLAFVFLGERGGNQASAAQLTQDNAAVFKDKDKLIVSINLGNPDGAALRGVLSVQLLGPDKKSLGRQTLSISQTEAAASYRFELPATNLPIEKLTLHGEFGAQKFDVPLQQVLLAKAHETSLSASPELYSNSDAAIRCGVHGCKSYTSTVPLAGADVNVQLTTAEGKVYSLHQGKTEANGLAVARFKVPDLQPGQYTLVINTKSTLGEEKLEHQVKVKAEPKVLLVTDKPLYQPGQLMHLRALSLKPMDLSPAANADIVFEVEDAKGNKVFKKTQKTSEFGIAAVDFQLADEINMGDYQIRALLGDHQASKTVTVKKYVLPKFKLNVKGNKGYYLPKETIEAELQADYMFGKPVGEGAIKVTASTFDVQFKQFTTWEGKTDAGGHAKFEIKLPDYFVGQPLQKGDAMVKLEIKVTDTADHSETVTKTFNVSEQPIRVSLIPEGGKLVPNLENRVFAAAIYPDGSPAVCDIDLWLGREAKDKPFAALKTNSAGLAEFKLTPKEDQFRLGEWQQKQIEMLGGRTVQVNGQKQILDLFGKAKDAKGNQASAVAEVNVNNFGDNLLLRLDKAIYKGGDTVNAEIRTSAGTPTAYLDFVRGGQILFSRWFDVKDGKATTALDLPQTVFGTVEVHAYQMLNTGEIIRDSRVVYVQPPEGLKIDVKADQTEYKPGSKGTIKFQVTDAAGKPTAAALGVVIVDESVYALQDMQPGLEKVYFTLQEELLKPQVQAVYRPAENIDVLVREQALPADKQQIAQVLLTSVQPKLPQRWELDPAVERRQKIEAQVQVLAQYLHARASNNQPYMTYDEKAKKWLFAPNLLNEVVKTYGLDPTVLKDPFGQAIDLNSLAKLESHFTVDNLARAVTIQRMQNMYWQVANYAQVNQAKYLKDGKWTLPEGIVKQMVTEQKLQDPWGKDAWGEPFRVVHVEKKVEHQTGMAQWDHHQLLSAGPDRKFGTDDDVKMWTPQQAGWAHLWWLESATKQATAQQGQWGALQGGGKGGRQFDQRFRRELLMRNGAEMERGGIVPLGVPGALPPNAPIDAVAKVAENKNEAGDKPGTSGAPAGAPILRVREYFPETMLWRPSLITDDKGVATLPLEFADSITTWRLSASASSRLGLLGGTTANLRVFQDFFVDIDLPVSLTQNDEVAFPVAVYNYLKTPQTVTLELQPEPWFELVDGAGLKRSLDLKAGEVTAIKFRIRANKIGFQPLLVKAVGTKMSDAIRRLVEVAPDGKRIEITATDRLTGNVAHTIDIPQTAITDSQKLLVKLYPGVFSQVLEGTEGMLRMPCGCFEQTSSSAYPNILVADYIKSAKVANAQQHLMKAEQYLNAGYQRLLTFERPGGGFDWWGSGEPLVWLSAYGLQEFNDMSRVWPVDRGVIQRTQAWLMKQQNADGSWDKIGATHGETIERMGNAKLLLTSYVAWALLDSGMTVKSEPALQKAVDYILAHVDDAKGNAYVTALAANALAAWDAKDDRTYAVLQRLDKMQKDLPEWKAACFEVAGGQTLTYARGDCVTIETTGLAALAMLRSGQFTNSVNKSLTYLIKTKEGNGTWGTTQATILALKALIRGAGGAAAQQNGEAAFTILVNGKAVKEGKITQENADVMQQFELAAQPGRNDVEIKVKGESSCMYQIVGRYYDAWANQPAPAKPAFEVAVDYDRTELTTKDTLRAKATMKYLGDVPTYMIILDLGLPPGFTVDAGDFAEMVGAKKIQKFALTSRQATLYIGDVKPGDVMTFEYTLKPKYPIKAKTPASTAYEYNAPSNRASAKPVELKVDQK